MVVVKQMRAHRDGATDKIRFELQLKSSLAINKRAPAFDYCRFAPKAVLPTKPYYSSPFIRNTRYFPLSPGLCSICHHIYESKSVRGKFFARHNNRCMHARRRKINETHKIKQMNSIQKSTIIEQNDKQSASKSPQQRAVVCRSR